MTNIIKINLIRTNQKLINVTIKTKDCANLLENCFKLIKIENR